MTRIFVLALLVACGAAHAGDPGWVRLPGVGQPNARSYYEWNPSSAQKATRDDYPTHKVIMVLIRIHDPATSGRPQQMYVDCIAQEQMTVYVPGLRGAAMYIPIPLETMPYAVWDLLCNQSQ